MREGVLAGAALEGRRAGLGAGGAVVREVGSRFAFGEVPVGGGGGAAAAGVVRWAGGGAGE